MVAAAEAAAVGSHGAQAALAAAVPASGARQERTVGLGLALARLTPSLDRAADHEPPVLAVVLTPQDEERPSPQAELVVEEPPRAASLLVGVWAGFKSQLPADGQPRRSALPAESRGQAETPSVVALA